jgi:hypothetical protein
VELVKLTWRAKTTDLADEQWIDFREHSDNNCYSPGQMKSENMGRKTSANGI